MSKSEFYFENSFKIDKFLIQIEGERTLAVKIRRKDCPELIFCGKLNLLNPKYPGCQEFYCSRPKFIWEKQQGNLMLFISSERDKTPVLRIPLEIMNSIIDRLTRSLKDVPAGFIQSSKINLNESMGFSFVLRAECTESHCYSSRIITKNFQMNVLSSWIFYQNLGVRTSREKETQFIHDICRYIVLMLKQQIILWNKSLERKANREAYISSEKDQPIYLFCEDIENMIYFCLTNEKGDIGHSGVSCLLSKLSESEMEKKKAQLIESMIKEVRWNYWQYRVVIAQKNNSTIINFMKSFIKNDDPNSDRCKYLKKIFYKWTGKSMEAQWGSQWSIVGH